MNYPPMHEQSCGNCRYSRSLFDVDDAISCRRHAPVIVADLDPLCYGSWPMVPIGQWCGEWCGR